MMPQNGLGPRIDGQQVAAEPPGMLGLVVSRGDAGPRPAVGLAFPPHRLIHRLRFSHQSVEHAVLQRHPFPERASRHVDRRHDLAPDLARRGVDQLARLIVAKVKHLWRGDDRVAVDHEALRQRPPPEHGAVEGVEGHQRVQQRLLALVPGDVAEGLEHAPAGGHGHLRRRTISRVGKELRHVRRADQAILRDRVVVRTVIGMAPVIRAFRGGLDELSLPQ